MEKLYFKNEDALNCYPLEDHLEEAKEDGLLDITLMEAIPDDGTSEYIWCQIYDCVQKCECSKKYCTRYESKSGRGKCANKGSLYFHGEKVKFNV
jgi:hypothetical protein